MFPSREWDLPSFIFFASLLTFNQYFRPVLLLFEWMFKISKIFPPISEQEKERKIMKFSLNVDTVECWGSSKLCLVLASVSFESQSGLFIFKTVSRFQFYPTYGKTFTPETGETGRGDLGIRGNIWIKKATKGRRKKRGGIPIQFFNSPQFWYHENKRWKLTSLSLFCSSQYLIFFYFDLFLILYTICQTKKT